MVLSRRLAASLALVAVLGVAPSSHAVSGAAVLEAGPERFGGEYYASLTPALMLDTEAVALELRAPFRLRLNGTLSRERGFFRREDWDSLSDTGRALHRLDVILGQRTFVARLGALAHQRLGHGTLVCDYGNSSMPDAQPLGLSARLSVGPVATEVLAGNVLGLDLTAVTLGLEPLSLWGEPNDRMHLVTSAALDWKAEAVSAQRFGVFGISLDGTMLRTSAVKLAPYVDFNSSSRGGHGLHAGLLADFSIMQVDLSLRGEYRHTRGPYQPEYFDVAYPLERKSALIEPSALALGEIAKADVPWGTNDTWRAEARLRAGPISFAGQLASRGRDPFTRAQVHDASGVLSVEAGPMSVSGFAAARQFAWGHNPARVLAMGELRYRINPYLHAWTIAGHQYRLRSEGETAVWQLGGGIGGALGF
ncbi:MAG: hypothetical protein HY901_14495 [Deltaproteobacteria bacterium]|nr:hypothetical protein [Deltaproteobacteria bacterium]